MAKEDQGNDMSINCMRCGINQRTGGDLLCNDCRIKSTSDTPICDSESFQVHTKEYGSVDVISLERGCQLERELAVMSEELAIAKSEVENADAN